jgi:hypothetical protein
VKKDLQIAGPTLNMAHVRLAGAGLFWLVAAGWFVMREKYYWLVVDKPSEHTAHFVSKNKKIKRRLQRIKTAL